VNNLFDTVNYNVHENYSVNHCTEKLLFHINLQTLNRVHRPISITKAANSKFVAFLFTAPKSVYEKQQNGIIIVFIIFVKKNINIFAVEF
jgi:hypothetical protein